MESAKTRKRTKPAKRSRVITSWLATFSFVVITAIIAVFGKHGLTAVAVKQPTTNSNQATTTTRPIYYEDEYDDDYEHYYDEETTTTTTSTTNNHWQATTNNPIILQPRSTSHGS